MTGIEDSSACAPETKPSGSNRRGQALQFTQTVGVRPYNLQM